MAVARAKKKKGKQYDKRDYKKVAEANRLCLACAIEQAYEDLGWRDVRINRLVSTYDKQMCKADELMRQGVADVPTVLARQAGNWLGEDLIAIASDFGDEYKQHCYRLCLAILVQTLKVMKVNKLRIRMIVYEIRYDFLNYEIWSVYKAVADKTGCDVREVF